MEFTTIGRIGQKVSRIGLGTWSIGGTLWGGTDEQEAVRTIHAALAKGVNLIDTAPVYGLGRAEEIVGRALAEGGRRGDVVVATKAGLEWSEAGLYRNSTPARFEREVEDSLRRLQTEYIDLYQIHWPDPLVGFEEVGETLERLREQGKIRAIGVSNYTPEQMARFRARGRLDSVQPPYNLFERGIERDVLPYAREHQIAVLAYGALCRGLLSGRMRPETRFSGDDLRQLDPKFQLPRFGQYLAAVERLERLARERYAKGVLELAVRWLLDQPGVNVALWGARQPAQLDRIDGVPGWSLDAEGFKAVERILVETVTDPVGPEFMAPPARQSSAAT